MMFEDAQNEMNAAARKLGQVLAAKAASRRETLAYQEILDLAPFEELRRTNSIVAGCLNQNGSLIERLQLCIQLLAKANENLEKRTIELLSIAPMRIKLEDGTIRTWRCPEEHIPIQQYMTEEEKAALAVERGQDVDEVVNNAIDQQRKEQAELDEVTRVCREQRSARVRMRLELACESALLKVIFNGERVSGEARAAIAKVINHDEMSLEERDLIWSFAVTHGIEIEEYC